VLPSFVGDAFDLDFALLISDSTLSTDALLHVLLLGRPSFVHKLDAAQILFDFRKMLLKSSGSLLGGIVELHSNVVNCDGFARA